jgi:hypothetical protein
VDSQPNGRAAEGLEVTPEETLRLFASEAIAFLRDYFAQGGAAALAKDSRVQTDARIAVAAIATWTRSAQTRGASRALDYQMARDLAENKDELRRYVEITFPGHGLVKALKDEDSG